MAKKGKKTNVVASSELDELVNEGKNIDITKVEEVLAENATLNSTEVKDDSIIEEHETHADEVVEINKQEEPILEEVIKVEEEVATAEPEETIDDVIAECTGKKEEKPKKPKKKTNEPWYVARAKRAYYDYYNW